MIGLTNDLFWLLLVATLGACSQTPFTDAPLVTHRQPQMDSGYELVFENPMVLTEQRLAEFVIRAQVPVGTTIVTAEGLPPGAQLVSSSPPEISWTPPAGSAKDSKHPERDNAVYTAKIGLRSSLDAGVVIQKTLVFVVNAK